MKRFTLTLVMLLTLPLGAGEIRADDGHGAEKLGVTIKAVSYTHLTLPTKA